MTFHSNQDLFNMGKFSIEEPILNSFTSGLVAGSIGAFAVYPIDVVKTRMQNQNKSVQRLYSNGFDCWRKLWQEGRFRPELNNVKFTRARWFASAGPFYRGCIPQLIGVAPEKAVKLFAYTSVIESRENNFWSHFLGGITAGTCQVAITNPYEMIKINLQMNNKINWGEIMNLKKLYTGASACFLRDIPFSGIYFPAYWYLKEEEKLHIFLAGTLAGAPSAFLCTPADVIKTRMQTLRKENSNIKLLDTIKTINKNEGFQAFWKGGGWRVMRSSPQFGVTLMVYEFLTKHQKDDEFTE